LLAPATKVGTGGNVPLVGPTGTKVVEQVVEVDTAVVEYGVGGKVVEVTGVLGSEVVLSAVLLVLVVEAGVVVEAENVT